MFGKRMDRVLSGAGQRITWKRFCLVALVAFIVSLVPIAMIAPHNMPSADDYGYNVSTRAIFLQTGELMPVVKAAAAKTADTYLNWQGTFINVFLMSMGPNVFGDEYYVIVPFLMVGILTTGVFLLVRAVLGKMYAASIWTWLLVAIWLAFFCIQTLPSAVSGLFWYNGALHYTFSFSLSLILFSLMFCMAKAKRNVTNLLRMLLSVLLGIAVGGGNLVTGLSTIVGLALTLFLWAVNKNPAWKWGLLPFAANATSFFINITAPGNNIRKTFFGETSILNAIWEALCQVPRYVQEWTNPALVVALLLLAPALWHIARFTARSFRYPLLWLMGSWCFLGVQLCPGIYVIRDMGPDRMVNVYYFTYILLLVFNLFYLLGWLNNKLAGAKSADGKSWDLALVKVLRHNSILGLIAGISMFVCLCVAQGSYKTYTSYSAAQSLITGEATTYSTQLEARLTLYEDEALREVAVEPLRSKPYVLYYEDITDDPNYWSNQGVASFYGKDKVYLLPSEVPPV